MTCHGFSLQLLAVNYGTILRQKCCEFSVTMQFSSRGSFLFFKERSLVKAEKCDLFAADFGMMSRSVIAAVGAALAGD